MPAGLSIGDLSAATGVAPGTLRMWEARHGFPAAGRGRGGHRRYADDDVARVARVLEERRHGLSLAAAIERVRHWTPSAPASPFASVRAGHPELAPQRLPVRAMRALSHAVEDECMAVAAEPLLVGCFQHERAYRRVEARWRELARTAALAIALADFPRRRSPRRGPVEVPLAAGSHVRREWAVVCLARGFTACVAGWELPADGGRRRFEALWTTDATAVVAAARAALEVAAEPRGFELLDRLEPELGDDGAAATLAIANRAIGYLAGDRGSSSRTVA
jgi:MerR family transcriptional regulator, light-induced transcriptional regulator